MILYYHERNGDYLAVDTGTNAYYRQVLGQDTFEGRAAAIECLVGSVCTTGIARAYLAENCKKIAKTNVPAAWREAIGF